MSSQNPPNRSKIEKNTNNYPEQNGDKKSPCYFIVKSECPIFNQKHQKTSNKNAEPSCDAFKRRIRDPNTYIALATIFLVLIGVFAINISRDTEKRQLRAYVTPIATGWRGLTDSKPLSLGYNIVNYGQTPAKNVWKNGTVDILPYPLPKGYIFKIPEEPVRQKASIFPKAEMPVFGWVQADRPFTNTEINEITSTTSSRRAYAYGTFTYTDIFEETHTTNFCFFIDPASVTKNTSGTIETFVWAICEQHTDFN